MPELSQVVFVNRSAGNTSAREILGLVQHELALCGIPTSTATDAFEEQGDGTVFVMIPHKQTATAPTAPHPTPRQLRRTIALCVEQPGTRWFELSARIANRAGAALDVNRVGVRRLRELGIPAEELAVGYSTYWDRWLRDESLERPTDVIHLGTDHPRRLAALASYASILWPHRTRILLPEAEADSRPTFLDSEDKWAALCASKVLLNVHRQPFGYFDRVRVLESISNGCVVVSESSDDTFPLVAGEHYLAGTLDSLGLLVDHVVRDPLLSHELRLTAYDFVKRELGMRATTERVAELAAELASGRARITRRRALRATTTWPTDGLSTIRSRAAKAAAGVGARTPAAQQLKALRAEFRDEQRRGRACTKSIILGQLALGRQLRESELRLRGVDPKEIEELVRTPVYDEVAPRVSAIVPLYNHTNHIAATLASLLAVDYDSFELIVLDDASNDSSREVVVSFLDAHPGIAARLIGHRVNCGLGRTRNDLVLAARGEFVFPLDADNEVYPTAFERLVEALETDPDAMFAYSVLELHANGVPQTLMGYQPWDPERLRVANYIDAMAMIRRDTLLSLGGYTEDLRLHGWEDYDLWCRAAENGLAAVHVPQILARYRSAEDSMLSLTNIDTSEARRILSTAYPNLIGMIEQGL